MLPPEVTMRWLADAIVRFDGGPPLDAPRLGPALRELGFCSVRRRRGAQRLRVWLAPGAVRTSVGRPRAQTKAAKKTRLGRVDR